MVHTKLQKKLLHRNGCRFILVSDAFIWFQAANTAKRLKDSGVGLLYGAIFCNNKVNWGHMRVKDGI